MGQYDDITAEQLGADLVAFARLILRLEEEDGLLASPADLQRILGELRQKIFAYEIRSSRFRSEQDPPREQAFAVSGEEEALLRLSLKVVREALRRGEEMEREWNGAPPGDDEDHE